MGYCQDKDYEFDGERKIENWVVAEINKQKGYKRELAGYYESKGEAEYILSCMKKPFAVVMSLTEYNKIRLKEVE